MKILLLGSNGQLGTHLRRTLSPLGGLVEATRSHADLRQTDLLVDLLKETNPDLVVNAAAYTDVDGAELDPETAHQVNTVAPGVIAAACLELDAVFVHYSTDYVFGGVKQTPYTEEDSTHPLNIYGQTKLDGEKAIESIGGKYLIFRTAWLYSNTGENFFRTMLQLAQHHKKIKVVTDQIGSPTTAEVVADITAQIVSQKEHDWGVYHLAAKGEASRFAFAKEILSHFPETNVIPVSGNAFPTFAKRPRYSVLSSLKLERTYNIEIPSWQDLLKKEKMKDER